MAKIRLKKLLHEIHSRSIWQVLSVYVAGSWGVLQAVEMVQGVTGLPDWILPAALVLLLIGLPIVLATAVIQGGPHLPGHHEAPAAGTATATPHARPQPPVAGEESPRRFFTWRNTLLGGAGAAVIWVLLAAGWFARDYLVRGPEGAGELDLPIASAAESGARLGAVALGADRDSAPAGDAGDESGGDDAGVPGADGPEADGGAPNVTEASTTPPPPPTAPATDAAPAQAAAADRGPSRAAIERARAGFESARLSADSARRTAARLRADEMAPAAQARADSVWNAGDAAAAAGRYADATRLIESAGQRFAEAAGEARALWRARIDAASSSASALREAADPAEPRFEAAAEREREGERLAAAGELPEAAAAFDEAADAFREIPRPEPEPGETASPPVPTPREIVEATLGDLSRALTAEDLARVRSVWVSLTEEQAENLSTFFRRWDHIDVTFDPDWSSLRTSPAELTVTVYTTWRFMEEGEAREQPPFEQTFRIIERESRWVILDG